MKFLKHTLTVAFLQKDPTSKGKKKVTAGGEEEEVPLKSYPESFSAHVEQAREWLRMVTSSQRLSQVEQVDKDCLIFEHPRFGDIKYQTFQRDVKELHEFAPRRPYTLFLADIPYGYDKPGCLHNDKVQWGEAEIGTMLRAAKVVTKANAFSVIIMHSTKQSSIVRKVLEEELNAGTQDCIW